MKIAICSQGEGLDSLLDTRFGRCPYLVVVDEDTGDHESYPNPAVTSARGAGVASAQFLSSKGVGVVLTANVGPNALSALGAAGIEIRIAGEKGGASQTTVSEALENYKSGKLPLYRE